MFLCPYCKQDYILEVRVKKTGQLFKICPECDTVWNNEVSDKEGCGFGIYMKENGLKGCWEELETVKEY